MRGLPFAFSKNPAGAGWTAVVVPSVVTDREARKILLQAQKGDDIDWGDAIFVEASHSTLGVMDVIFRESREQFTDGEGRPFRIYEGILLPERGAEKRLVQEHLDAAREAMQPMLDAFWGQASWSDEQSASSLELDLSAIVGETPLKIVERRVHGSSEAAKAPHPSQKERISRQARLTDRPIGSLRENSDEQRASREAPFGNGPIGNCRNGPTSGHGDRPKNENAEGPAISLIATGVAVVGASFFVPKLLRWPLGLVGAVALAIGATAWTRSER